MRSRRLLFVSAVASLTAAGSILAATLPAAARPAGPAGGEHPPECIPLVIHNPGGGRLHLDACGFGSLGESWALDSARGGYLVVDGAYLRGRGCGSVTLPCSVFWTNSPTEGADIDEP